MEAAYRRVLLKLSGETFGGERRVGIEPEVVDSLASQLAEVRNLGVETAVVIGAGNIWRGAHGAMRGMDRATGDYMGMLGTVINSLALQDALERKHNTPTRLMTAIEMREVAEPYVRRRAIRHLEKGRIVIFAAGTGHPFFSTDTAAALRAAEINAQVMLKATKEDGVYDADPRQNPSAVKFERIRHAEVLSRGLRIMDATATALCMENGIPIIVFDLGGHGNIKRVVLGEAIGTYVGGDRDVEGDNRGR